MMRWKRAYSESLSLEEVAGMSDAEAVRREFDSTNIKVMAVISAIFFFASFITLVSMLNIKRVWSHTLPLAITNFGFAMVAGVVFGELALSERRRGRKPRIPVEELRRNLTPWIMTYILVEFALICFDRSPAKNTWMMGMMTFPWMMIPLRMAMSRRAALHISLIVIAFLSVQIIGTTEKNVAGEFAGAFVVSVFAFIGGTFTSRRVRISTIEQWTDRRSAAREQVRMRDELRYAREVQLSMLPDTPPNLDWLDVAGMSVPATEVGGDYFDYFADKGSVALVCGDVAGHGLASGIVLASLRSGFTLLRDSLSDPAAVLQRLNDLVAQTSRRRMLATAAVVLFDRDRGEATIASAGHPPVIVRHNGTVEPIELFAPPLGVRLPFAVPSRKMSFRSGDIFVLHSDGVYESQNPSGESYGFDRLQRVVSQNGVDAEAIRDAIIRDVEEFRAGVAQDDDVTVVVARVV